eukprot:TRINITY_DN29901_c0_g1_i1.p1 TRINITY_DN29901_c0_g1~~TRINITY_DN29901_c0_g1_i1.p1  ORF type:complete len:794 (+),score=190.38 TRINITY_DN29901_c0_g1_i1:64-2445(+)
MSGPDTGPRGDEPAKRKRRGGKRSKGRKEQADAEERCPAALEVDIQWPEPIARPTSLPHVDAMRDRLGSRKRCVTEGRCPPVGASGCVLSPVTVAADDRVSFESAELRSYWRRAVAAGVPHASWGWSAPGDDGCTLWAGALCDAPQLSAESRHRWRVHSLRVSRDVGLAFQKGDPARDFFLRRAGAILGDAAAESRVGAVSCAGLALAPHGRALLRELFQLLPHEEARARLLSLDRDAVAIAGLCCALQRPARRRTALRQLHEALVEGGGTRSTADVVGLCLPESRYLEPSMRSQVLGCLRDAGLLSADVPVQQLVVAFYESLVGCCVRPGPRLELHGWAAGEPLPYFLSPQRFTEAVADRLVGELDEVAVTASVPLMGMIGDVCMHRAADLGHPTDIAKAAVLAICTEHEGGGVTGRGVVRLLRQLDDRIEKAVAGVCAASGGSAPCGPEAVGAARRQWAEERRSRAELIERRSSLMCDLRGARAATAAAARDCARLQESRQDLQSQLDSARATLAAVVRHADKEAEGIDARRRELGEQLRHLRAATAALNRCGSTKRAFEEEAQSLAAALESRRKALALPRLQVDAAAVGSGEYADAVRKREQCFRQLVAEAARAADLVEQRRAERDRVRATVEAARLRRAEQRGRTSVVSDECAERVRVLLQCAEAARDGASALASVVASPAEAERRAAELSEARAAADAAESGSRHARDRMLTLSRRLEATVAGGCQPLCASCELSGVTRVATHAALTTGRIAFCEPCAMDPLAAAVCPVTGRATSGEVVRIRVWPERC